jgi:hypothetical protein
MPETIGAVTIRNCFRNFFKAGRAVYHKFASLFSADLCLQKPARDMPAAKMRMAMTGLLLLFILGNIASTAWHWAHPFLVNDPLAGFPRVFLWAWERPENLEFLDPRETGVAVLAKTLILKGSSLAVRPRMQPIGLPPGIITMAVVRIESNGSIQAAHVRREAIRQILELTSRSASGIQIDFDARASERSFYRDLLTEVRNQLPRGKKLSITALASWCIHDAWIKDLPVDEAVPMLFRLGIDERQVKQYLAAGNDFRVPTTRFSFGISMDETPVQAPGGRRVYVFNPQPWTRATVHAALRYVRERR